MADGDQAGGDVAAGGDDDAEYLQLEEDLDTNAAVARAWVEQRKMGHGSPLRRRARLLNTGWLLVAIFL